MTASSRLVVRAQPEAPAPAWTPHRVVALPLAVTTAAWAIAADDGLHVWINRPRAGRTEHVRVRPALDIEPLPPLPLVLAGVTRCGERLVATGSVAGRPTVVGLSADGTVAWEHALPDPRPSMWPVPCCAPDPVVVWQVSRGSLELASADPGRLGPRRTVAVGSRPLAVAGVGDAVWVAWSDAAGLHASEITALRARNLHVTAVMPAAFALGACPGGACLAWARGGSGFLARLGSGPTVTEPPASLDLRGAPDGTLTLLGGPVPMVWAQRLESIEGEPSRWRSVLGQPGESPLLIDGPVHAAAWWGDAVALVGTQEVMLLRQRTVAG